MVHIKKQFPFCDDGTLDIQAWIQTLNIPEAGVHLVHDACNIALLTAEDKKTNYGASCFYQGLETAENLSNLHLDYESIASAIVYSTVEYADLDIEVIEEQLSPTVAKLVKGVHQLSLISQIKKHHAQNSQQIDNIRKMLLAIVRDVRVVVIKLAERLSLMRAIRGLDQYIQHQIAQETIDIYAPLANRLGLYSIKWELEDLSFFYLHTDEYKDIAKNLAENRLDREQRVHDIIETLNNALAKEHISANIHGRAKHIYSIKRKMLRKNVDFSEIYDAIAVRILVDNIDECYLALSIVHNLWQSIPKEFDDYITSPKENGYQSIHTAVIGPDRHHFEIQIRTHKMHEDSEMGVAAHWIYKEGNKRRTQYEEKITWLRNLLDWQKELIHDETLPAELEKNVFEDRVYVFSPKGDIIDLPTHATPLDFAYHVHTDVGHRCRGAKINGKIVPLTYQLQTGDRIEILTAKVSNPSRDWLVLQRGYLKTSSARAKVLQWFKHQDYDTHLSEGRGILEKELQRLGFENINLNQIANRLKFKTHDAMLAALGNGDLRLAQIINLIHAEIEPQIPARNDESIEISSPQKTEKGKDYITIHGMGDLMSHIAKCCNPIPGDPIVGYVTQGKGITIHHQDCHNIVQIDDKQTDRIIEIRWNDKNFKTFPVNIEITAFDRPGLARDITTVFANEKINLTQLKSRFDRKTNDVKTLLTLETDSLESLSRILSLLSQLPNVMSVRRLNSHSSHQKK